MWRDVSAGRRHTSAVTGKTMDVTLALQALQDELAKFHGTQPVRLSDGAVVIEKLKPRSDGLFYDCYLHEFYAPLTDEEMDELEQQIGRHLSADMRSLYRATNGFSLFCGSVSVGGYRRNNRRGLDQRLPISLRYGNVVERFAGDTDEARESRFVFGFYSDGDGYALSQLNDEIYLTPRRAAVPPYCSWLNLEAFLDQESKRLMVEFSRAGSVDPLNPLRPPCIGGSSN